MAAAAPPAERPRSTAGAGGTGASRSQQRRAQRTATHRAVADELARLRAWALEAVQDETDARLEAIRPVLAEQVRAGGHRTPASLTGGQRALRNCATHALLGRGRSALPLDGRSAQRLQRAGRPSEATPAASDAVDWGPARPTPPHGAWSISGPGPGGQYLARIDALEARLEEESADDDIDDYASTGGSARREQTHALAAALELVADCHAERATRLDQILAIVHEVRDAQRLPPAWPVADRAPAAPPAPHPTPHPLPVARFLEGRARRGGSSGAAWATTLGRARSRGTP